jgi:hypothetical protein
MQRTFFYTQIKSNDFKLLKDSCQPFSKDIFSADQEHIIAFDQPSHACKAALKFLNHVFDQETKHEYKIVLVNGGFSQDRPEDLPVRVARSIHQSTNPKNLIFTEDVLQQINMSDIVFEQKKSLFVKALQKEIPTFSLSRFEDTELHIDPTDLFDFSHVDSYSTVDQVRVTPDGEPIKPRDPFESSNTTIELDPIRNKLSADIHKPITAPQNPYVTGPQKPYTGNAGTKTPSQKVQTAPRPSPEPTMPLPKGQPKSIAIILVLLVIVTGAGFYLAKFKSPPPSVQVEKTLPVPQIPEPENVQKSAAPTTQTVPTDKTAAPVPEVGYLNINSAPKGADISVNGKKLKSKTPLSNFKVTTMYPVEVEVTKSGYNKAVKRIDLEPKATQTVMFQLTPAGVKAKPAASKPKLDPKAEALAKAKALSEKPAKKKATKKK